MRKYETMSETMNRIRSSNEAGCIPPLPPASREELDVLVGRVRKLEKRVAELESREQAVRAPSAEIERLADAVVQAREERKNIETQIRRLTELAGPLMQIARILEKEDDRW